MVLSFDGAVVRLTVTIEGSRAPIDYLGGHAHDPGKCEVVSRCAHKEPKRDDALIALRRA